ncbi:peptidoglycan-binding protein [Aerophototrophica crusticola]|uniref:Peptidoglycan-binding protein n=1 Tax=Aerophototrophica crusticola TaxID=1709002 RepID=A0A858R525_9PROT|nr:peptidoglycan-binding protein [Rhodospirillaceae bacterium B3]
MTARALPLILAASLIAAPATLAQTRDPGVRMRDCAETSLTPDQQAALVKATQQELAISGFDAGKPDGTYGRGTAQAIRAYQKAAGMPVTGCPSQLLLERLRFGMPKIYSPTRPQAPSDVVLIQEELLRRGYWPGPADGRAGKLTEEAIRQFQVDTDQPLTGEPTPQILTQLKVGNQNARR